MPIGARRMTHHRAFWSSSSTASARLRIGCGLLTELEGGDAGDGGHEDDLQDVSSVNGVMTSVGMMPVRKSSQDPASSGFAASCRR